MSEQLALIRQRLSHLGRMRVHLEYSHARVVAILPRMRQAGLAGLSADQHEALAAFRVRFSEFQEHLGKAMRSVAVEEEVPVERFGTVLAFMEKLAVLDGVEHWREVRDLRNAVNHEYEEDEEAITALFAALEREVPTVLGYFARLAEFCAREYGIVV